VRDHERGDRAQDRGGVAAHRDETRAQHRAAEDGEADHQQHQQHADVDGGVDAFADPGAEHAGQRERRQQALHQRLAGADGDDDEAPEDHEVVLAAHRAHEPRPAAGGQGGFLDDLLLAEEVGPHRLQPSADAIGAALGAASGEQAAEAAQRPGKGRQRGRQHQGEDDSFHGLAWRIVTQRAARRELSCGRRRLPALPGLL
jgi:hypothetical protein